MLVGCGTSEAERWLFAAVDSGNLEAVKQHIAAGTGVNAKMEKYGHTPLHRAANGGHKEIAELLIAEGAYVNAKDENGWTPLHDAANGGHKEVAELLIAKGANVNAKKSETHRTPLDWAIRGKHHEIANLLRKHGGKTAEELEAVGN